MDANAPGDGIAAEFAKPIRREGIEALDAAGVARAQPDARVRTVRGAPPPFQTQTAALFAHSELSLNLAPAEYAQPIVQSYVGRHIRAGRVGDALVEVLEQAGRLDTVTVEHSRLLQQAAMVLAGLDRHGAFHVRERKCGLSGLAICLSQ